MTTKAHKPLRVFCSYSRRDEEYVNELRDSLSGLERQGLIEWWHDREIAPGWEWEEAIDKHLRNADIILLLISITFMASDYVYEKEIQKAVERHQRSEALVIPIILKPADWKWASFSKLLALPKDATPITTWPNQDEAWLNVVEGVRRAVEKLLLSRKKIAPVDKGPLYLYREVVKSIWVDEELNRREAERLRDLAKSLELSDSYVATIERDVMGDTKEALIEQQPNQLVDKKLKAEPWDIENPIRTYVRNQRLLEEREVRSEVGSRLQSMDGWWKHVVPRSIDELRSMKIAKAIQVRFILHMQADQLVSYECVTPSGYQLDITREMNLYDREKEKLSVPFELEYVVNQAVPDTYKSIDCELCHGTGCFKCSNGQKDLHRRRVRRVYPTEAPFSFILYENAGFESSTDSRVNIDLGSFGDVIAESPVYEGLIKELPFNSDVASSGRLYVGRETVVPYKSFTPTKDVADINESFKAVAANLQQKTMSIALLAESTLEQPTFSAAANKPNVASSSNTDCRDHVVEYTRVNYSQVSIKATPIYRLQYERDGSYITLFRRREKSAHLKGEVYLQGAGTPQILRHSERKAL